MAEKYLAFSIATSFGTYLVSFYFFINSDIIGKITVKLTYYNTFREGGLTNEDNGESWNENIT